MADGKMRFEANNSPSGEHVRLLQFAAPKVLVGRSSEVSIQFDDWTLQAPPESVGAIARLFQAWADNEVSIDGARLVNPDDTGATLHPALVASLSDVEAQSLGLPPTSKLSLNIQSQGLLHTPDFKIDARWTRPNGLPALVTVSGARQRYANADWRIPEPLWSIAKAAGAVNAASDEAGRMAALASLRGAMGEEFQDRVRADGYLERLRLNFAAGFSLDLQPSAGGFDFDPVLFGKSRMAEAGDGAVLDQDADMLLPPVQQASFAKRFRQGDGSRRAYLLDDGSLLFLDPGLKAALGVVRRAQAGSSDERRKFAGNPRRAITEKLADENASPESIADLFVETQQFSERVSGIDVWRKPVLPWIKPKPNSWLPEKFGLRIGVPPDDQMVEVAPDKVQPMLEALEDAVREDRASFTFDGTEIPATPQAKQALTDLAEVVSAWEGGKDNDQPPPTFTQRYFLQVRDNLEDVAYAPIGRRSAKPSEPPAFPAGMRSEPKAHQISGFQWLAASWLAGVPGVLLADDMGLGKTFQAISFLVWLRQVQKIKQPVLIVAPTGLLANWRAEIARHAEPGTLGQVLNAYGAELTRVREGGGRDIEVGEAGIRPDAWNEAGIVLTTFETMRDYHLSFARQPFAAIIYDEAQKLKNPASQMTRAAKTLNARFQLAMTGTPVENRLQDLWSVVDVLFPGILGSSKTFETSYPSSDPARLKALHDILTLPDGDRPALLLRRMKDDCLPGMPAKRIEPMEVDMPPGQALAYDKVIHRAVAARGSGQRGYMLEILHMLRGVSLHPVAPEQAGDDREYFSASARLQALFDTLDKIKDKQEKVLIFCESLAMQALVAVEIKRRYGLNHTVARIHGGVTGDARQRAVDEFQSREPGFDAMVLSPKAGGVGLTLTAANHVVHLSRWWNPAVEDQATDRVFRIGQTKDVTVYLPQAVHPDPEIRPTSFDLKLDALMRRKRELSRGLLIPGEDDADTSALFESILGEGAAQEPSGTPGNVEAPPTGSAESRTVEPTIPFQQAADPVSPAPTARASTPQGPAAWPKRKVYEPDQTRDFTIFTAPISGEQILLLEIRDPYACASPQNRACVVDFVALIAGAADQLQTAAIICYDPESVERNETDDEQYFDLRSKWNKQFGAKPDLRFKQISRRQNRNFHDRWIVARTSSGRTLTWDAGNGVDGVMKQHRACTVTLTED